MADAIANILARRRGEDVDLLERPIPTKRGSVIPYQLAMLLQYGRVPGITRLGAGRLLVNTVDLGQHMRKRSSQIHFYLEKLEVWGVVTDLELHYGTATLRMVAPPAWDDVPIDRSEDG